VHFTEKGTLAPARAPSVTVMPFMWAFFVYPVSRAPAAVDLSVVAAAWATLPCCQSARNRCAVVCTSVADSGPDLIALWSAVLDGRASADAPPSYSA
jgi:hypothetical protein